MVRKGDFMNGAGGESRPACELAKRMECDRLAGALEFRGSVGVLSTFESADKPVALHTLRSIRLPVLVQTPALLLDP